MEQENAIGAFLTRALCLRLSTCRCAVTQQLRVRSSIVVCYTRSYANFHVAQIVCCVVRMLDGTGGQSEISSAIALPHGERWAAERTATTENNVIITATI